MRIRNKRLYKLSCVVGGGLLLFCPIIEMVSSKNLTVGSISLSSIGSGILGAALLIDYCGYHGDAEQYKNWWKQIAGYFFLLLLVSDLLPFSSKVRSIFNIVLYAVFLSALYIRYNQLKT